MNWLANLSTQRAPWLLFSVIILGLELIALFFQYQMGLAPCIMCIYQRSAVLGLFVAGIVGSIKPNNLICRMIAFTIWGVASIWGFMLAREHIAMQTTTDPFAFSCEFEPNFPNFMPLHHWQPWFFEATGDCGNIDWVFMTLSMPQWMQIIFASTLVTLITLVAARIINNKSL
ncbi:disulfide bond formation protein DsbB [Pseudoalteromonas sp. MMG010]|uniref:disulfide bond formation protein DsbB n=1 Tax=Pseudoalteromonas sp. MMG010 TaxID=2822685 RepID=UPI001B39F9AE|nr:disulfide bond formation protein DsbB [Pseudoalteromonas sp. MMG010]MBQ4831742.1 disulfide bond formation protein DsbB [Pseudoalteromonas sp. MMG010]